MDFAELWEKLREQEVVDYRLLIALPVLLVVGVIALFFFSGGDDSTSGRSAPGLDEQTYVCHFDQTEVKADGETLWEMDNARDAIISRGGSIPTRLRCTKCNRMSCFRLDAETGEPIEVSEDWDLSEDAQAQGRTAPTSSRGDTPSRTPPTRGERPGGR